MPTLMRAAAAKGLTLSVEGDGLVIEADREPPAALLAALRAHKVALVAALLDRDHDPDERAGIVAEGSGVTRAWAEGYAALAAVPPPPGFLLGRWERIIDAADVFLDRWSVEAIRCGWSDLDVFGCHDSAPTARFDCMGLVMLLNRCEVVAIDQDGADLVTVTGPRQRFRRRKLPPGTVALWQLGHR